MDAHKVEVVMASYILYSKVGKLYLISVYVETKLSKNVVEYRTE